MKVEIDIEEIKEVFFLLEELNDFFHQKDKYSDTKCVEKFADNIYPLLNKSYYDIVWNWFPQEVKKEITE